MVTFFSEITFSFQRQEQMSQTELDVSHGYAFSQVTKQKSFLLGLSFTYLDAGGEGCSIPNRVYTKI